MVWMNSGIALKTRKKLLEMGNLKRKPKKKGNAIANIKRTKYDPQNTLCRNLTLEQHEPH